MKYSHCFTPTLLYKLVIDGLWTYTYAGIPRILENILRLGYAVKRKASEILSSVLGINLEIRDLS